MTSFGYGTSFAARGADYIGMAEERKPLWASFWAFTGEFGDPLSNYDLFADIWMWIYAFFTTVVMVNLLVAMMANTYEVVKENAQAEALSARYRRIFEHRRLMLVVPLPFNMLYVIVTLLLNLCKQLMGTCKQLIGQKKAATKAGAGPGDGSPTGAKAAPAPERHTCCPTTSTRRP